MSLPDSRTRSPYRPTDTAPLPSIDWRAYMVSLPVVTGAKQ